MSKMRKGYDAQDRVIAGFKRDLRSSSENSAVMQCMRKTKKTKMVVQKETVRYSYKELFNKK